MKNNGKEIVTEEGFVLNFRARETEDVSLKIPSDILVLLEQIAKERDMSVQALLKFYIGQGLRQDAGKEIAEQILKHRLQGNIKESEILT